MAKQFSIIYNEKYCKNCGICAAFCPKQVYAINEFAKLEIVKPEECIGCRMCMYRCPDMALIIEEKQEG